MTMWELFFVKLSFFQCQFVVTSDIFFLDNFFVIS